MEIDGDKVVIGFSLGGNQIGTDSRAAIRTDTILGARRSRDRAEGQQTAAGQRACCRSGRPPRRTRSTTRSSTSRRPPSGWDIETVKRSLNVLSDTIDQTYPHLSAALDGVARFSDTIGKRDEQFKQLLANANKMAGVLGDRSGQINQLLVNARRCWPRSTSAATRSSYAAGNVSQRSRRRCKGFINDNPNLNHVLEQLRTISDVLVRPQTRPRRHADHGGEIRRVAGRGAWPRARTSRCMLVNLLPGQIIQPFVDAAFKKRGIDPEEFWRDAGLPAFRFPDPNGSAVRQRRPAAGATRCWRARPDHPGPAVPPGSPCSYTPPPGRTPDAGQPAAVRGR